MFNMITISGFFWHASICKLANPHIMSWGTDVYKVFIIQQFFSVPDSFQCNQSRSFRLNFLYSVIYSGRTYVQNVMWNSPSPHFQSVWFTLHNPLLLSCCQNPRERRGVDKKNRTSSRFYWSITLIKLWATTSEFMKLYLPLRLLIARSCKSSLRERPADITQGWFNTLNTSAHFLV